MPTGTAGQTKTGPKTLTPTFNRLWPPIVPHYREVAQLGPDEVPSWPLWSWACNLMRSV
jgi:hypothetical protein